VVLLKVLKNGGNGTLQEVVNIVKKTKGTFESTGSDQAITHGHGTDWTNLEIQYFEIDSGVTFSGFSQSVGEDHFHITVSPADKTIGWSAESW
jgi:hypothetical protein